MLIKIDMEKAYETINQNVVLVTLSWMCCPPIWTSWIKTYISSGRFSFLINGQPSKQFFATSGARQGDPLSLYLFILISHNLTAILNQALNMGIVLEYDSRLIDNFNHLMYVDDLIHLK